nr:MAG TPA: Aar2-like protein [Caudoviricetes sp.]
MAFAVFTNFPNYNSFIPHKNIVLLFCRTV